MISRICWRNDALFQSWPKLGEAPSGDVDDAIVVKVTLI